MGRIFERLRKVCGGSNLSTGSKSPKCIYKISKNFRVEKNGEISRNLSFSLVFVPASKSVTYRKLTSLDFRLWRIFARPAPGEQAPQASGGECEPTRLLRKRLGEGGTIPANKRHPLAQVPFVGWDSWTRTNEMQESKSCAFTNLAISHYEIF